MDNKDKITIIKGAVNKSQAKNIGDKLGIKKDKVNLREFTQGVNVEREHGSMLGNDVNVTKDNAVKTGKIAWAHLREIKDYYTRLKKMENDAKNKK